ncbi:MAG: nicotinate-nucleotide adenylyltransferase [Hyphomicrobiales bacterium]
MTRPRGSRFSVWLPARRIRDIRPKRSRRLRVGLLGGSFNPAHEGHLAISREALERLDLDRVWWLVSPQNPLKDPGDTAPYETRIAHARAVARHPRIDVCDLEQRWQSHYTIETVSRLEAHFPAHAFVFLMGADNFAGLHHWEAWTEIVERIPIAVINRPGYLLAAMSSRAAQRYRWARVRQRDAGALAFIRPPAWSLITVPLNTESSTEIRAKTSIE